MNINEPGRTDKTPIARQSFREDGLLDEEWTDFCLILDDHQSDWSSRFERISKRMDRIDYNRFPAHLKCPVVQCYRRTVIGARHTPTQPGFEAVLAHWRLQCVTPIHGHPPVLMYRALSGLYRMTMYRLKNGIPEPVEDRMVRAGDWFYHVGDSDGYDHFIHTIECIEEGWTLNLYSDDAQKGVKYSA